MKARQIIEDEQENMEDAPDLYPADVLPTRPNANYVQALYKTSPVEACKAAIAATRQIPENKRIAAIAKLLGAHSNAAIHGKWQNGYWGDIVAVYCNMGDMYAPTVLQARGGSRWVRSRFIVSSYGDFVEARPRLFDE